MNCCPVSRHQTVVLFSTFTNFRSQKKRTLKFSSLRYESPHVSESFCLKRRRKRGIHNSDYTVLLNLVIAVSISTKLSFNIGFMSRWEMFAYFCLPSCWLSMTTDDSDDQLELAAGNDTICSRMLCAMCSFRILVVNSLRTID